MAVTEYIATDSGRELLQALDSNPELLNQLKRPGTVETLVAIANEGPLSEDELVAWHPNARFAVQSLRQKGAIEPI